MNDRRSAPKGPKPDDNGSLWVMGVVALVMVGGIMRSPPERDAPAAQPLAELDPAMAAPANYAESPVVDPASLTDRTADEDVATADGSEPFGGVANADLGAYAGSAEDEDGNRAEFDEDAARRDAEREAAKQSYVGIGRPFGCTIDCGGHDAGYRWRAEHGSTAFGNGGSFRQGEQAFDNEVTRRVEEKRDEYEDGADDYEE